MNVTERTIFQQFPLWEKALAPDVLTDRNSTYAVIGCGTSYNLALSLAANLGTNGFRAIAVPAGEWLERPECYVGGIAEGAVNVIALSRSGESTETVLAAAASRKRGQHVIGITCAPGSALTLNSDTAYQNETHAEEGIVMTASASLMLVQGIALSGANVLPSIVRDAEKMLLAFDKVPLATYSDRTHFVFLGGGALYGVALEGALKLQEMALTYTQGFHPNEYRHGPVSLVDERTAIVMLYHPDTRDEEAILVAELRAKGALVIGFGGPGDVALQARSDAQLRPIEYLPALQCLGERVARARGIDTQTPRHLTKVVTLMQQD